MKTEDLDLTKGGNFFGVNYGNQRVLELPAGSHVRG
jgi:hypothetical protein